MLSGQVKREGRWTEIPRQTKLAAHRTTCACCRRNYGYVTNIGPKLVNLREALDHVFPRRWIEEKFSDTDPHRIENLVSICNVCHGAKKAAEEALYRGDALDFVQHLRKMHYPMDRVAKMASILQIEELRQWVTPNTSTAGS